MQAFREGRAKDILSKYLYDYRNQTENENFHFLIGLCMYQLGYYEEAHIAFRRSQKEAKTESRRGDIFDALVLLMAQKDEEAAAVLAGISLADMTVNEIVTAMVIKNKLRLPVAEEYQRVINSEFQCDGDRLIMYLFAAKYADHETEATELAKGLTADLFQDFQTYMYVVEEVYKLHMVAETDYLLDEIEPEEFADDAARFGAYINTCYAVGYYNRTSEPRRVELLGNVARRYKASPNEWHGNISKLYCMEYDRLEQQAPYKKGDIVEMMRSLDDKTEQVLLYITTYDIEHFDTGIAEQVRQNLEKLITSDQTNRRYRKLYCDLLIIMGCLHQADEVTKATLNMRKREENEEFSLLYSFHSFYMPQSCMLKYGSVVIMAFITPWLRMMRVSARVSTCWMPVPTRPLVLPMPFPNV